ncbi:gypsy type transposase [Tanacetum coccineum]
MSKPMWQLAAECIGLVDLATEGEKNDPEFSKKLASLADLYVNAFGTAHKAHVSTEGVAKYLKPSIAGYLTQKELHHICNELIYTEGKHPCGSKVSSPNKPFATIVGGSKVSSKIGVIESLLEKVNILVLGGGMIFTFYKAQGYKVGSSLVEEDKFGLATSLLEKANSKGVSLLLPSDVVIAHKFAADANSKYELILSHVTLPDNLDWFVRAPTPVEEPFLDGSHNIYDFGRSKKEVLGTLIFFTPWIISLKALTKLFYPHLSDVNDILLESAVELIGSVCQFNQVHAEPVHVNKRLLFGVYSIWIRSCLSVVMVVSRSWDCIAAMVEGMDTIQLEDAVSTISQEYLLEFTSEYGIPKSLHPELPGPEEPIVEFPEGKVAVYTKFFEFANFHMDLFNLISAPNPTKVKTRTRAHAAHEVPLLTATASRVIDMEDTNMASESSGTPSVLEKSPLDFANENPPSLITKRDEAEDQGQDGLSRKIPVENPTTTEVIIKPDLEKEVAAMGPLVNKRRRKRGNDEADANAPPKVLRKDHATFRPAQSTLGEKSLASMGLEEVSTFYIPATQETLTDAKSVSDPDPLSYTKPQPHPEQDVAQSSRKTATEIPTGNVATTEVQGQMFAESPNSRKSASFPSVYGSLGDACQDMVDHIVPPGYFSELHHLPNTDFLSQCNINMARQVAMGSQLRLRFEQEVKLLKKATTKIAKQDQRIQAKEEEIKRLDQEIKSLRVVEVEVHSL